MCQHNKAGVVASSRHDKVGDIECLAPDPSSGDRPSGEEGENGSKEMERQESSKKVMAKSTERESNDGKRMRQGRQRSWRHSVRGGEERRGERQLRGKGR